MDNAARFSIAEHQAAVAAFEAVLASQLDPAATMIAEALVEGHKVLTCGSGSSAVDGMLMASLLMVRFKVPRKAYPAVFLTVLDQALADHGRNRWLSRQVEGLGESGDVLVTFSADIPHVSVMEAIAAAKRAGMRTLGLSGKMGLGCDVDIQVPSNTPQRVQELHGLCAHLIIETVEGRLPV